MLLACNVHSVYILCSPGLLLGTEAHIVRADDRNFYFSGVIWFDEYVEG